MIILGINAYHGDASAAIVVDGKLVAAAAEERFNRVKHCAGFPSKAIQFCLKKAGVKISEVDHIAVSRDPKAHVMQKILYSLGRAHKISGMIKDRLSNALRVGDIKSEICRALDTSPANIKAEFHRVEHHRAHMASAFLVSPMERSLILSIDGMGDFVSTMWGKGEGNNMEVWGEVLYPHSLGMLYTAVTQYLGFKKYGDEGKVMGLAPYGEPAYTNSFDKMVNLKNSGKFELNLDFFRHHSEGVQMTWDEGSPVLGDLFSEEMVQELGPARNSGQPLEKRHEDIAATLQFTLEKTVFKLIKDILEKDPSYDSLCLAGGVALNCVMNEKIPFSTPIKKVWIQPGAGDDGTAVGAAYYVWNVVLKNKRNFLMEHAYTGPEFKENEIKNAILQKGIESEKIDDLTTLCKKTASAVADGKIVGWFQGAMEFGPRALGNRSIVADPRRPDMKDILNKRIKHREPFRPFAPSVLEEKTGEIFENSTPSPFMLLARNIRKEMREKIPAVTHVDGTGRLQTVSKDTNPRYHALISAFNNLTGIPVVLNTSFNENEPIVCTPTDALDCFIKTKMDVLVMGDFFIERKEKS